MQAEEGERGAWLTACLNEEEASRGTRRYHAKLAGVYMNTVRSYTWEIVQKIVTGNLFPSTTSVSLTNLHEQRQDC